MGDTLQQLLLLALLSFSAVAPQVTRAVKPVPNSNLRVGERDNSIRIIQKSIIETVNKRPNAGWTAAQNPYFANYTIAQFKHILGVKPTPWSVLTDVPAKTYSRPLKLPREFDARSEWSRCSTIGTILDQGHCGSCWAFGAVECLQDRFCIHFNMSISLSVNDLLACCGFMCGDGCDGGYPIMAWRYFVQNGVVTDECDPYFDQKGCKHPGCEPAYPTPKCDKKCKVQNQVWQEKKHFSVNAYRVNSDPHDIMAEVYQNGPVEVAFTVYEDFAHYKSGVYKHITGGMMGGHAVKLIGWGTSDAGEDYWHSGSHPQAHLARPPSEPSSRDSASLPLPPTVPLHQNRLAARPLLSGHRLEARFLVIHQLVHLGSSNPVPRLAHHPPLRLGAPPQLSVHHPPLLLVPRPPPLAQDLYSDKSQVLGLLDHLLASQVRLVAHSSRLSQHLAATPLVRQLRQPLVRQVRQPLVPQLHQPLAPQLHQPLAPQPPQDLVQRQHLYLVPPMPRHLVPQLLVHPLLVLPLELQEPQHLVLIVLQVSEFRAHLHLVLVLLRLLDKWQLHLVPLPLEQLPHLSVHRLQHLAHSRQLHLLGKHHLVTKLEEAE